MRKESIEIIEEMAMSYEQTRQLSYSQSGKIAIYRKVTPLELSIKTLCLVFFTPDLFSAR